MNLSSSQQAIIAITSVIFAFGITHLLKFFANLFLFPEKIEAYKIQLTWTVLLFIMVFEHWYRSFTETLSRNPPWNLVIELLPVISLIFALYLLVPDLKMDYKYEIRDTFFKHDLLIFGFLTFHLLMMLPKSFYVDCPKLYEIGSIAIGAIITSVIALRQFLPIKNKEIFHTTGALLSIINYSVFFLLELFLDTEESGLPPTW